MESPVMTPSPGCSGFRLPDPDEFQKWFLGFMRQFAQGCEGVPAVDGKTLRRSYDRAEAEPPLRLVSAWAAEQRPALGQLAVDGKSDEITAAPKLLEMPALPGMVVTADAMHSQRQLSRQIPEQGADCVPALKGNQESLNDDVRLFPDDPATPKVQATTINKGHGRIGTRTAGISGDAAWLQERRQWPGLAAVGKITASRQQGGRTSVESRCCLLSQAFTPERFNHIVREHRGIGNRLHGSWTWCSTRTSPETGRTTAPAIRPCYGSRRWTWPGWNPRKAPSEAS
jgi:predicted transposase YbfD/YdcC